MERKLDDNFVTEEYYAYAKSLVISKRTLNTAWLEGYYEGLDEGYRIRIVLRS